MFSLEKKLIKAELKQRSEEGCNTEDIAVRITAELEGEVRDDVLSDLYDELMALPVDSAFPYTEPSTLEEIRAERPEAPRKLDMAWDDSEVTSVEITSLAGKPCRIDAGNGYRVTQGGEEIAVRTHDDGSLEFDTIEGQAYLLSR